ncbi:MAG TPA: ABC transporter ATP-binding protein [Candidatus Mediterraneibacter faecavium]|uniref:ABC transporter ATP-binding protein n=1 Tax=Candidatus Mediterraneibacter faecavium TaxID=2838668 RepID=A0A9D2QC78_9FIRM|nr:ABC transporter ATP-binding protein [Candidatus Mediterraneibacter faecavium]
MMLECRELTKWFGSKEAVADLTLNLDKGKIYGLLGENGSGKTTWMKMVAGLTKPGRGEILYEGHPIGWRDKAKIAYMATEPFFYDFMKVSDVGEYYEAFFEDFDRRKYTETVSAMGLEPGMKVRNLSSGMSAKLKLAATLSRNAELYLLDEPLNGIDYKAREEIIGLILEEANGENTFVISTHLLEEVESFIEYAIFIKDGHLADKVNLESERMKSGRSLTELYTDIL